MESTNGVGATLETYMAKMLTKILQTPIKINGADGPIASNILRINLFLPSVTVISIHELFVSVVSIIRNLAGLVLPSS